MSLPIRMSMPFHFVNLRDICIIICSFVPALGRLCVCARLPCLFDHFVFAIGVLRQSLCNARFILDNLETSFSRTSQANVCPEFYRPVRSSAYAKPMPMRTQTLVSSVTVLARGAIARPAPRARSARAADGGLGSRAAGHGVAGVAHGHAVAAAHAVAMAAHGVAGVVAAVAAVGAAYGT